MWRQPLSHLKILSSSLSRSVGTRTPSERANSVPNSALVIVFAVRQILRFVVPWTAALAADASGSVPGVRPASRSCVSRGLPSAWLLQTRQCLLPLRSREGSEHGGCGLGAPREMIKDSLDHDRTFEAREHLDHTTTALAGQDFNPEYTLQPLRLRLTERGRVRRQAPHRTSRAWPAALVHAADGSTPTRYGGA
jgi:hypothetical protein